MLSSWIRDYFGFNKQQRNGLFVLVLICFILLLIRLFLPVFIKPQAILIKDLPVFERKLDSALLKSTHGDFKNDRNKKESISYFVFNPNTVSREQLLQLGLSERTVSIFLNYRSKGGRFKTKRDLQKVYGIREETYLKLEPFILIDEEGVPEEKKLSTEKGNNTLVAPAKPVIEINTADSGALIALNGIGPVYAKRILKYRSLLGGFASLEQLNEVYGFTSELYENLKPQITLNVLLIKKLNLNKDDFKTINKHPYLSYEMTKKICASRHKTPLNADELRRLTEDEQLYLKLLPYCRFD